MTSSVAIPLLTFAIVMTVTGGVLQWRAIAQYGKDLPRFPALNPKHWRPVWTMRDRFETDKGFNQFMWGGELMQLGFFASLIVYAVEAFSR